MSKYNLDLLWDDKSFDIEYRKYSKKNTMRDTHYHMHYEIYYQLSGDRYYFIQDKTYYIQPGSLVWLKAGDIHKTLAGSQEVGERILINFKKDFLSHLTDLEKTHLLSCFNQEKRVLTLNLLQQKEMESLLHKMLKENKDDLYSKILLCESLILNHRYLKYHEKKAAKNEITSPKYQRITKVSRYLNQYYNKRITLENVAEAFFISPSYLSRTFKETTGFNFIAYLNYVRINHAKQLLRDTDLKVIDISVQVGFENITHFNKVFREIEGVSPLKYRKNACVS